jgi:hypothetical protein
MEGSWEHLFHIASNSQEDYYMHSIREEQCLSDYIPHRAIGVVIIGTRKVW